MKPVFLTVISSLPYLQEYKMLWYQQILSTLVFLVLISEMNIH